MNDYTENKLYGHVGIYDGFEGFETEFVCENAP